MKTIDTLKDEIKKISTWWRPWQSKENIFMRRLVKHTQTHEIDAFFNASSPTELFCVICADSSLKKVLETEVSRQTWSLFSRGKPVYNQKTIDLIKPFLNNHDVPSINPETTFAADSNIKILADLESISSDSTIDNTTITSNPNNVNQPIQPVLTNKDLLAFNRNKNNNSKKYTVVPNTDNSANYEDTLEESQPSSRKTSCLTFFGRFNCFRNNKQKIHPGLVNNANQVTRNSAGNN